MKKLLVCIISAILFSPAFSQAPNDRVDLAKIQQRSVRDLVQHEGVRSASDFQALNTSCYRQEDSLNYHLHLKTYHVKAGIEDVWKEYSTVTPRQAWSGKMVHFGFLYSRLQNRFIYADSDSEPMDIGNIIYVNLKLLNGLKNLGVAFEVTDMDPVKKQIRFCYLKDGVSKGSQEIHFTPQADGTTLITHETHYRSDSRFRDRSLYPRFHEKLVGEFHENLRKMIEGK
jgi:hypothetical protein